MNNLVIGNTSQLSFYFPNTYKKISSIEINFESLVKKKYKRSYILFSDQRTFLEKNEKNFNDINFNFTIEVIDKLIPICDEIIVYSTAELWNNYDGKVDVSLPFNYNFSPYIKSKELLSNYINSNREKYKNVIILYPFNFNSVYRKEGFLFHKIFDSIINKNIHTIGEINFNRDILHPIHIVKESLISHEDKIIGSGFLTNVKKFIEDLFVLNNLDIDKYLKVDIKNNFKYKRNEYYSSNIITSYEEILNFTNYEIQKNIIG